VAVGLAKKVRTPPPRQRQQGPRRRDTRPAGSRSLGLDRRGLLTAAGAAGVLVVAILVVVLTRGGGSGAQAALRAQDVRTIQAAGCTVRDVPPLAPTHGDHPSAFHQDSPTLTSKVKWSTFPPSAGGHYQSPAVWGFYRKPVNPRLVVHNEEHGGLIVWWGDKVPAATVDRLQSFYDDSPVSVLGTPIAGLGSKISLTAWTGDPKRYYVNGNYGMGHIMTCSRFDAKAFALFRDAFRGHGPEGLPMSANQPGT
jgi:hypothetical protein